jgi:hypothetical protein
VAVLAPAARAGTPLSIPEARALELSAGWHALGYRERIGWLWRVALAATVVFAALVVKFEHFTPVYLLVALLTALTLWRPRIGFYFALGFTLLFENGGPDMVMEPGAYFHRSLQEKMLWRGVIVSPLEILLLVTGVSLLVRHLAGRRDVFRKGALYGPVLLFGAMVVFGYLRGAIGGGGFNTALWEVRFVAYIIVCYFLAVATIRTPAHLGTLLTIVTLCTSVLAIEFTWRRIAIVSAGLLPVAREFAYAHESAALMSAMLILLLAQLAIGGPLFQRVVGLASVPVIGLALLATERRAGFIAFMVAALLLTIVFVGAHRKAFFLVAAPLLLGGALYLPLFWNSGGIWSQPARAVKSLTAPDTRDAASNQYRVLENQNIRATIQAEPLTGVGFGREFHFVVPMPNLDWWPFWRFEPHNNILWIWLKTGAIGFVFFWHLMGTAIMRSTHQFKTIREPRARAVALLALGTLLATLTYCWVDLGLVTSRLTVFLGIILGLVGALDRIVPQTHTLEPAA